MSFHFLNYKLQVLIGHFFIPCWDFTEQFKYKPSQRIKLLLRKVQVQFLVQVMYIDPGVTEK
jgi:hypothetical protein